MPRVAEIEVVEDYTHRARLDEGFLRRLRPAAYFRRGRTPVLPEPEYLLVEEIVAGVLEPGEVGLEALRRRGADELREEAAIEVAPARLLPLGGAFFPLPGIVSEKIHLLEVEVARPGHGAEPYEAPQEGDGSPLEEGALLTWRELGDALRACDAGEIEDAKTELALRRLSTRFATP